MDTVYGLSLHKWRKGKREIGKMWSQHNLGMNWRSTIFFFFCYITSPQKDGVYCLMHGAWNNAKKLHKTVEISGFSQIIIGKGEPWRCLTMACNKTYIYLNRNCSKTFLATNLSSSMYIIFSMYTIASLSHHCHRSIARLSESCRFFEVYWVQDLSFNLILF